MSSDQGGNCQTPMQDPVVLEIAKKYGKSPGQVLLRFLVQSGIAVIPRSSKPERVKQNIDIFDFELSENDYNKLKALEKGEAGRQLGKNASLKKHPEYPFDS
uniref:1,5-anhydro-D-fructose reductase n=2 Tax=Lygus hesperus TaxID=30085 RepID=A0A0A9YPT7_LYGHE